MKLDHDCIRQVLIDLENNLQLESMSLSNVITRETFETFGTDNVIYSVIQLIDAGYIDAKLTVIKGSNPLINVKKITWEGHKFLDNVRDPQVWTKTKAVLKHLESTSITLASNVASQVITNLIEKMM